MEKVPEEEHNERPALATNDGSMDTILVSLLALLEGYSKLLASMHQWAVKDYIQTKIGNWRLRELVLYFLAIDQRPDSKLLEHYLFNRKRTYERIREFCDILLEPLEDIGRFNDAELKEIINMKELIVKYKGTIPEPKKSISYGQISLIITTVSAIISVAIQLSFPNQSTVIFLL